jgi:hypothetical protein
MIMARYSDMSATNWLKQPSCNRYHCQSFYPSLTPPSTYGPGRELNLFTGFAVSRETSRETAGDAAQAQPLLDHIRSIWCRGNETHYQFVMSMFAHILQKPWEKLAVVLCLVSKQGSGKGIVLNKLGKIMGSQTYAQVSDPKTVFGDFNESLSCKCLVVLDEMLYAGNHQVANQFKSLITEDQIRINPKYGKPWTERMYQNYVITSNSPWIIQASADQRRFFCLEPADTYSGVNTRRTRAYFEKLLDVPAAAFARVLYDWDLNKFNPREIPSSEALVNQQRESLSAVESALYECLQRGTITKDNGFTTVMQFGMLMPRSMLFDAWSEEFGQTYGWPTKPVKFWGELKRVLPKHQLLDMHAPRATVNGKRERCVTLAELDVMRAYWEKAYFRDSWDS